MNKISFILLIYWLSVASSISAQTPCSNFAPNYYEDFEVFLDSCWSEATGVINTPLVTANSGWQMRGFGNISTSSNAAYCFINSPSWLISPSIDLGTGSSNYELSFDVTATLFGPLLPATFGTDDTLAVVISTDNGLTWSSNNILRFWTAGSEPTFHGGDRIFLDLASYTGVVKFGFYVLSANNNTNSNNVFIDNFEISTLNSCAAPSALVIDNITSNNIRLDWTENGTSTQWEIEYGANGFEQGTGTKLLVNTHPVVISNLSPYVGKYAFHVRAICGVGDTSRQTAGRTATLPCGPSSPPYSTTFEDTEPQCWIEARGGTATTGPTSRGSSSWSDVFSFYSYVNLSGTGSSNWLMSPTFDLSTGSNLELVIEASSSDNGGAINPRMGSDDSVQINISIDSGATWTTIYSWNQQNSATTIYNDYLIDLSAYNSTNTMFGIRASNGTVNDAITSRFNLKRFEIRTAATCPTPSPLRADSVTMTTANLGFVENGSATEWQIEYGLQGFVPGTGILINTATNPFRASGLTPDRTYDYYARAICGIGDSSTWSSLGIFQTLISCPAPSLPTANAITTNTATIGWTENGNATQWEIQYGMAGFVVGSGTTVHTTNNPKTLIGLQSDTHYDYYIRAVCGANDSSRWSPVGSVVTLISCPAPSLLSSNTTYNATAVLHWTENATATQWQIEYGLAGFAIGTGTIINTTSNPDTIVGLQYSTNYDYYIRSICGPGDTSRWSPTGTFYTPVSCNTPYTTSSASTTATTATISWAINSPATQWEVEYGLAGFAIGTGITQLVSTNPTVVLSGLQSNSNYHYYIRSICGIGDTSNWSSPNTLQTACLLMPGDGAANAIQVGTLPYYDSRNNDSCYTNQGGFNTYDDLFYQFVIPPCTNSFTISLCGSSFNTILSLWAADATTYLTANNNYCGTQSSITINVNTNTNFAVGDTIYIVIEGNNTYSNQGLYNLAITSVACPPFEDIAPVAFLGMDSIYCGNDLFQSAQVIVSNQTAVDAYNVPYRALLNNNLVLTGSIPILAANSLDTLSLAAISSTVGSYNLKFYTYYQSDSLPINDTISIIGNSSDITASIINQQVTCFGLSDGSALANTTNGIPSYQYLWSNGTTNAQLTNVAKGLYTVVVSDSIGCIDSATANIIEPPLLTSTISTTTTPTLNSCTGTIDLTISGGIGTIIYNWSNGDTSQDLTNVVPATYMVTISDGYNCPTNDTVTIVCPPRPAFTIVSNQMYHTFMHASTMGDSSSGNKPIYSPSTIDQNQQDKTASVTGIPALTNISNLHLFPNPTNATIFVQLDLIKTANVTLQVTTIVGQSVVSKVVGTMQSELIELPTNNLASGVYILHINTGTEQITRKFVVAKH